VAINLAHLPVIDNHAHPFLPEKENSDFRSYWTTSLLAENTRHVPYLLTYRQMLSRLAPLVGADADTPEETIVRLRNERYAADRAGYIRSLFRDAQIETVFIDVGYPTMKLSGYDVPPQLFSSLLPSAARVIVRIEPIIMELIERNLSFGEFIDEFITTVEQRIADNDTVALKTAIAYFAGLEVRRFPITEVKKSFATYMREPAELGPARPFLNHMVRLMFSIAKRHALPVQMHTGFGNAPLLNLAVSNPVLLFDLLADGELRETPIVLLHSGYPFTQAVAYLVNNYPNVYVDISQVSQYISAGLDTLLAELLSMAPVDKVLYGSDGLGCPELFWWPARHAKDSLALCLDRLVAQGMIRMRDAEEIASRVLMDNAKTIYPE